MYYSNMLSKITVLLPTNRTWRSVLVMYITNMALQVGL